MSLDLHVLRPHSVECRYQDRTAPSEIWRERSIVKRPHPDHSLGPKVVVFLLQCNDSECYAEGAIVVGEILQDVVSKRQRKNTGK